MYKLFCLCLILNWFLKTVWSDKVDDRISNCSFNNKQKSKSSSVNQYVIQLLHGAHYALILIQVYYKSLMQSANKSFSHYSPSVIRQVWLFDVDVTFVSKVGIDINWCQVGK